MVNNFLDKHLEALIFTSPSPLKIADMQRCMEELFDAEIPTTELEDAVARLSQRYQSDTFTMEIVCTGQGYQFMSKPAYQESIALLLKQKSKKRLSRTAMETLSIIAYKQPVSRPEIEEVRGVNCDYALKKLLEKELIEIKGKSEAVGRPLIYGTSEKFMAYFGIESLTQLPALKDLDHDSAEDKSKQLSANTQTQTP